MHILECRCGIIRSVPTLVGRSRCIRCGRLAATHLWRLEEAADETGCANGSTLRLVRVPLSEAYKGSTHASLVDYLLTLAPDEDPRQTRANVKWDSTSAREVLNWLDQLYRHGHLSKAHHDFEVGRILKVVHRQLPDRVKAD